MPDLAGTEGTTGARDDIVTGQPTGFVYEKDAGCDHSSSLSTRDATLCRGAWPTGE